MRLFRLGRVARALHRFLESSFALLLLMLSFYMIVAHWFACIWWVKKPLSKDFFHISDWSRRWHNIKENYDLLFDILTSLTTKEWIGKWDYMIAKAFLFSSLLLLLCQKMFVKLRNDEKNRFVHQKPIKM